jgi:hypothetical protein
MTLVLMVQSVNSCKASKDQIVSSHITGGAKFMSMKKIEHFHRNGKEPEVLKRE